ncbi:uncharacterized protein LOC100372099 [Saccoglossus kowalevskii]|uniref:Uncharacterized protein LOC100372099 n=1 Tax=Saccoglossus kowalevskii TaxID=10224 RepID=A0ABM0GZE4_SACKO|nr:PREDICTED: uncharacterized protein LOC100372099 [Saccoglossus kowalevskii]
MLTRQRPYQGLSMFQIMERVRENKRPEIPESCPIKLGKLITMCWDSKPNKRPSFKDILISLEGLSFPPEWRDLFAAAGIPREAMNDVQSARSIIELVNKSVELSDKELMTSVRVVPKLDLQLSMDDNIIPCLDGQHVYQMNDSMSEDEDWNVKSIKESIDEFELKIPQSVLDTMHDNTAVDEQHHVHLSVLECNESDLVSERSVISEQCSVKSATDVHSDRSGGSGKHSVRFSDIDTHLGELPAAESKVLSLKSLVKFDHPASSVQLPKDKVTSEKGDHSSIRFENGKSSPTKGTSPRRPEKIHISETRDSSDKPARLSTAWEKTLPTVQKQPGNIPLPPPLPDVARSLAITQGARPKTSHSLKKTHPLRKTLAAPAASHVKIPVSELLKQKAKLKSTDNPHPSQLADLTRISHDKLTSIAEILKKAVTHRRVAMGEDAGSIEHSYPSGVWSVEEH